MWNRIAGLSFALLGLAGCGRVTDSVDVRPTEQILVAAANIPAWSNLQLHQHVEWRKYEMDEVPTDAIRFSDLGSKPVCSCRPIPAGKPVRKRHLSVNDAHLWPLGRKNCRHLIKVELGRDTFVESLDFESLVDVDVLITNEQCTGLAYRGRWRSLLSNASVFSVDYTSDGVMVWLLLFSRECEKLTLAKQLGRIGIRSPLKPTDSGPTHRSLVLAE